MGSLLGFESVMNAKCVAKIKMSKLDSNLETSEWRLGWKVKSLDSAFKAPVGVVVDVF